MLILRIKGKDIYFNKIINKSINIIYILENGNSESKSQIKI